VQCGVVMIVVAEPLRESATSLLVCEVELGVGPLLQERTDEALGLAVGLRSIGTGGTVLDPQREAGFLKPGGVPVAEGLVGEDGFDPDALPNEVDDSSPQAGSEHVGPEAKLLPRTEDYPPPAGGEARAENGGVGRYDPADPLVPPPGSGAATCTP